MIIDFRENFGDAKVVAAAVSGGSDSMALLSLLLSSPKKYGAKVVAINVEHGIRGESSLSDSAFVKKYCDDNGVTCISYSVNATDYAKTNKLSVEQAARVLRYRCFEDAIKSGKCDVVATAHHALDNLESVLFNLFRGTGLKGAAGILPRYDGGKIVRPLLRIPKAEINAYITENKIPYVTDETNFCDDYTRNFLRLNVMPEIKKIFPDAETSAARFCELVTEDEDFLSSLAEKALITKGGKAYIPVTTPKAVFGRAEINALKLLGIKKDWEKTHIDDAFALTEKQTGKSVNLLCGIVARREYDYVVFEKTETAIRDNDVSPIPFTAGEFVFAGKTLKIELIDKAGANLKQGLYLAAEKLTNDAVIRTMLPGDRFTKFGGGTKKLCDYLTDKKIPKSEREKLPLAARGHEVLAIFGVAVSDKVKAEEKTERLFKIN